MFREWLNAAGIAAEEAVMRRPGSLLCAPVLLLASVCAVAGAFGSTVLANEAARRSGEPRVVLVHPRANGHGIATTIQEGIDRVASGGWVLVFPGTYAEVLNVTKGVTIDGIGGAIWPVIVAPPGTPASVIEIATTDPVTLRGLTVHVPGTSGIRGVGGVDLTVERSTVLAVNPPVGVQSNLIVVINNEPNGSRARMVVRHNFVDGAIPNPPITQSFAVRPEGDVDALIEGNVLRRVGGACIFVVTRADLGGELNADILNNDLDECHPLGRVSAILVGPVGVNLPSPERPLTATGNVNIIGNTIRNSTGACLNSAIAYEGTRDESNGTGSSTS